MDNDEIPAAQPPTPEPARPDHRPPAGTVDAESIEVLSATREDFVPASLRAATALRFEPGYEEGEAVRVWVEQPIHWRPAP